MGVTSDRDSRRPVAMSSVHMAAQIELYKLLRPALEGLFPPMSKPEAEAIRNFPAGKQLAPGVNARDDDGHRDQCLYRPGGNGKPAKGGHGQDERALQIRLRIELRDVNPPCGDLPRWRGTK
jgi:hypothetical protein